MKDLKDYGHIHIDGEDEEYGTVMITVFEEKNKHKVEDDWGDITGEAHKIIGEFDSAFEAVKFGINTIRLKYPQCQIWHGAGQAPKEWIDKILEDKPII